MLFGAHVSIAGGLDKAIDRGEKIGANCIQTFASSPRTMKYSPYDQAVIQRYLEQKATSSVKLHVFHGVYLINMAHENPDYVQVCVESLSYYQKLASQIGGLGTVFHIGSHKGKGLEAVLDQVARAIAKVLANTPDEVWLLLENAAGQKGTIGRSIEELWQVASTVESVGGDTQKLGLCVDTQHAFASGYDIRTEKGLSQMLSTIDDTFGMDKLQMVHVNDSLVEYDSHRDRHANIGEGEIGDEGLAQVVNHPKLKHLPFILEVPGENRSGPRKVDVEALINLSN